MIVMRLWFRRIGTLLSLSALLAFALHLEPAAHPLSDNAGHHCTICHTATITPVPLAAASQPPAPLSEILPIYGGFDTSSPTCFADGWRGPPAA